MKVEKIAAGVLTLLVAVFLIVYFTLPEWGEQVYIPQETSMPEGVEIPEGYQLVDNFTDVYYIKTEDGYRYLWLVQFSDGSYGWQEVDKDGNLIFPGRGEESMESEEKESSSDPVTSVEPGETSSVSQTEGATDSEAVPEEDPSEEKEPE